MYKAYDPSSPRQRAVFSKRDNLFHHKPVGWEEARMLLMIQFAPGTANLADESQCNKN